MRKQCSREGCTKITLDQGEPKEGNEVTAAYAIAGGNGDIEIEWRDWKINHGDAATSRSPPLCPSATHPDFSDDEDKIGDWIKKSSLMARLGISATTSTLFHMPALTVRLTFAG